MPKISSSQANHMMLERWTMQFNTAKEMAASRGQNVVPATYSELFAFYYDYTVLLVQKAGIRTDEAEDVAMSILTTFLEKDALNDYDPNFSTEYKGKKRMAAFRTFLSGFVLIYVKHYRERIQTNDRREGLSTDTVLFTDDETGSEITFLDIHAPTVEEEYESLMAEDLVADIRKKLTEYTPRNGNDRMNLPLLFDLVLEQINEHDEVRPRELSELFGISKATTFNWLRVLRQQVADVLEARAA